jgi:hypothetical protein
MDRLREMPTHGPRWAGDEAHSDEASGDEASGDEVHDDAAHGNVFACERWRVRRIERTVVEMPGGR